MAGRQPSASQEWREPRLLALFTYGGASTKATSALRQALLDSGYSFDSGPNYVVGFDVQYRYYGRWAAGIVGARSTRQVHGDPIGLGAVIEANYNVRSVGLVFSRGFLVKPLRQGEIEVSAGFGPARYVVRTRDLLGPAARDGFETNGFIAQAGVQAVGGRKRMKLAGQVGVQYRKVGRGSTGPLTARTGFADVPQLETSFDDLTFRIALGVGF